VVINGVWLSIIENLKAPVTESLGYCELKQQKPWFDKECSHKPWFDKECSKLSDERKQAKLQWR
jgi:hypothetical protein